MENLFSLSFHEYMARRTKFAVDKVQQHNGLQQVEYAGPQSARDTRGVCCCM